MQLFEFLSVGMQAPKQSSSDKLHSPLLSWVDASLL